MAFGKAGGMSGLTAIDMDLMNPDGGVIDSPLFSMRKLDFEMIDSQSQITHVQVASNIMYIFTQSRGDKKMYRKVVGDPSLEAPQDLKVDPIRKCFISPSGSLIVFCTEGVTHQTYFYSKQMKKYKSAQKILKDIHVQCVSFNKLTYSDNYVHFILGSFRGEIYSVEYSNADIVSAKLLYTLPNNVRNEPDPVMSLEIVNLTDELCVFCATKDRIYLFSGHSNGGSSDLGIQNVFRAYAENAKKVSSSSLWLSESTEYSCLQTFCSNPNQTSTPSKLFWLAGTCVMEFDTEARSSAQLLKEYKTIPYPKDPIVGPDSRPKAFAVTRHHILLLYDDPTCIRALCPLNQKVMFAETLPSHSSICINICKDLARDTQYLVFDQLIFKYQAIREDRHIWQIYLELENFDWALKFAGTDHPNRLNEIYLKKAEYFFRNGRFDESADFYARTKASFEEIALKFIEIDKMSLKNYLCTKLASLKATDKAQITMLVLWIIQLYLSQIHLADKQDIFLNTVDECRDEFHSFLRTPSLKECLRNNMRVVYDLLGSHGDRESLTLVAEILEDYPSVIQNLVENEQYNEALDRLEVYKKPKLFYKYSSVLMKQNAVKTVDVWKKMSDSLQPKNLIPAIVQLDKDTLIAKQSISYLEFCLSQLKNRDTAIHNCLLTLYAMYEPHKLLPYLEAQNAAGSFPFYDAEYALRICLKHDQKPAIIFLYKTMKLYEEAVDQALTFEHTETALAAAQDTANYAQEQDEDAQTIKKLWLKIASYVVKDKTDVRSAMEFLRDNEHIKIEDILPFFPDFFTINEFKDAILTSLNEYNDSIARLKEEMQYATESADKIRCSIKETRSQYTVINSNEKCAICGYQLILRDFYSFPCHHAFHYDCLLQRMKVELSDSPLLQDIELLEKRIKREMDEQKKRPTDAKAPASSTKTADGSSLESMKEELDNLIASECPFCGEIMIQSIHKPFIPPERLEEELASWL